MGKPQRSFKSDRHNISALKINNISLSSNDDETIQIFYCEAIFIFETSKETIDKNEKINKQKIWKG